MSHGSVRRCHGQPETGNPIREEFPSSNNFSMGLLTARERHQGAFVAGSENFKDEPCSRNGELFLAYNLGCLLLVHVEALQSVWFDKGPSHTARYLSRCAQIAVGHHGSFGAITGIYLMLDRPSGSLCVEHTTFACLRLSKVLQQLYRSTCSSKCRYSLTAACPARE